MTFFSNFQFSGTLFSKIMPYFCRHHIISGFKTFGTFFLWNQANFYPDFKTPRSTWPWLTWFIILLLIFQIIKTHFLSGHVMIFFLKSTPIVGICLSMKPFSTNRPRILVLPTPESPIMMIFAFWGQSWKIGEVIDDSLVVSMSIEIWIQTEVAIGKLG